MTRLDEDRLGPVVPAYFHPAIAPSDWLTLADAAGAVRLVVLNVASGPGYQRDHAYAETVERLLDAGVPIAGYVDTDYGRRPQVDVLTEVARYRQWYQVSSVFLDRVASGIEHVRHYRSLAANSRWAGMELVAFNHGVHPVWDYAEYADLLGTFEGSFRAFIELDVPRWVHDFPSGRFFHLLYDSPPALVGTIARLATERNVGCVYRTESTGANPWRGLPLGFPGAQLTGNVYRPFAV
jgi:hypothetical protein